MKLSICTFRDKTKVLIYGESHFDHVYNSLGTGIHKDGYLARDFLIRYGTMTPL